jgi:chromosome segregation ATPase
MSAACIACSEHEEKNKHLNNQNEALLMLVDMLKKDILRMQLSISDLEKSKSISLTSYIHLNDQLKEANKMNKILKERVLELEDDYEKLKTQLTEEESKQLSFVSGLVNRINDLESCSSAGSDSKNFFPDSCNTQEICTQSSPTNNIETPINLKLPTNLSIEVPK